MRRVIILLHLHVSKLTPCGRCCLPGLNTMGNHQISLLGDTFIYLVSCNTSASYAEDLAQAFMVLRAYPESISARDRNWRRGGIQGSARRLHSQGRLLLSQQRRLP